LALKRQVNGLALPAPKPVARFWAKKWQVGIFVLFVLARRTGPDQNLGRIYRCAAFLCVSRVFGGISTHQDKDFDVLNGASEKLQPAIAALFWRKLGESSRDDRQVHQAVQPICKNRVNFSKIKRKSTPRALDLAMSKQDF